MERSLHDWYHLNYSFNPIPADQVRQTWEAERNRVEFENSDGVLVDLLDEDMDSSPIPSERDSGSDMEEVEDYG